MTPELIQKLQNLANAYEISSFCDEDPSQFMRWYPVERISDVECASFIAAMLAFGNRKQFIPKIQQILELADLHGGISQWCLAGAPEFPHGTEKFYRFYSYDDMHILFSEISKIINQNSNFGEFFHKIYQNSLETHKNIHLSQIISQNFPESKIVSKGENSANKRIHMFLRWMCRQNSPVDLGLWNWYPQSQLIIPLDVHVLQESIKLGLLPENAKPTGKTAIQLTKELLKAFPNDPVKADFALFGLGVDQQ